MIGGHSGGPVSTVMISSTVLENHFADFSPLLSLVIGADPSLVDSSHPPVQKSELPRHTYLCRTLSKSIERNLNSILSKTIHISPIRVQFHDTIWPREKL